MKFKEIFLICILVIGCDTKVHGVEVVEYYPNAFGVNVFVPSNLSKEVLVAEYSNMKAVIFTLDAEYEVVFSTSIRYENCFGTNILKQELCTYSEIYENPLKKENKELISRIEASIPSNNKIIQRQISGTGITLITEVSDTFTALSYTELSSGANLSYAYTDYKLDGEKSFSDFNLVPIEHRLSEVIKLFLLGEIALGEIKSLFESWGYKVNAVVLSAKEW